MEQTGISLLCFGFSSLGVSVKRALYSISQQFGNTLYFQLKYLNVLSINCDSFKRCIAKLLKIRHHQRLFLEWPTEDKTCQELEYKEERLLQSEFHKKNDSYLSFKDTTQHGDYQPQ